MRTFKQHIKEYDQSGVGTNTHVQPIEDGSIGLANVHDADVLKRVNAFVESIASKEYINPQAAVDQLRNKLATIGLNVAEVDLNGDKGTVTVEVSQFGGRKGKDVDGTDLNDDGISHKKTGGLKLEVKYEKLDTGTSKVFAKLV